MSDPSRTPVLELADALRDKELSATELLDACLAEVDRLNDELNAVVWRGDEAVRAAARDAAAATAGGMFPAAHANDGGGSIRIPAACCGLVGLKPSRGRVPRLSQSWLGAVVEGAVTRTVADAAAILDVLSGPDPLSWYNAPAADRPFREEVGADAGRLRIGLMDHGPAGMPTDPACTEAAQRTASALEELGHAVEPVELPTIS